MGKQLPPVGLIVAVVLALLAATQPASADPPPDIIETSQERVAKFRIVVREFSADQKQARYTLKSDMGIFRCRLNLTNAALTNLVITVAGEKHCEGLSFAKPGGGALDLQRTLGVRISTTNAAGIELNFSGEALNKMRPSGVLQYVNQYR